jgi:hypothetical protein
LLRTSIWKVDEPMFWVCNLEVGFSIFDLLTGRAKTILCGLDFCDLVNPTRLLEVLNRGSITPIIGSPPLCFHPQLFSSLERKLSTF